MIRAAVSVTASLSSIIDSAGIAAAFFLPIGGLGDDREAADFSAAVSTTLPLI